MSDDRKQFTMYESVYKALSRIKKKADRADAYDIICSYALYNKEPDLENVADAVALAFDLIRPVLDSARKKATSGKKGGSSSEANCKQTASKPQANGKQTASEKEGEIEKEKEKEVEIEKEIEVEVDVEGESSAEAAAAAANTERIKSLGGTLGQGVVFLSDAQMNDLLDRMGIDAFDHYVDKLSNFIIQKGARVKNHYETILKWWHEDGQIRGN